MPFGGALSLGASALGIGSSLASLFGGSPASKVQAPPTYQYQNQGGADQSAYSGIGQLSNYNIGANYLPQYQQIAQSSINNPYASQYQAGAGAGGALGIGSGVNAYNAGGALTSGALSTMPDVQALLSLGFDPQNALYSKLQQQNQDQTNAQLSQSGVGTTPYGAGVANQSNQNFNLGWQNQQLGRAVQGAQGAGSLLGSIGNTVNTGQGLQAGAAGQVLQGAGMPYNTFQGINANALQTIGQAGQFGQSTSQIPQQQIQDYLAYLSGGTGQQNANTGVANFGLNQANSSFNQNQQVGQNLGSSLAGLGKAYGNTGSAPFGWGNTSSAGSGNGYSFWGS